MKSSSTQAYAAARMAESSLLGLAGEEDVYECTYTQSEVVDGLEFFSSKVQLGPNGVEKFLPLGACGWSMSFQYIL